MSGTDPNAPSVDLDFTRGVMPSGLTFTRASIATNSFYTDAAGSTYTSYAANAPRLIGGGLYHEETRTNWLLNSDAPATQTSQVLGAPANTVYALWVIGTGSATTSAGTAVGTGFGTATAGNPNFFTLTGAGTVVVTVSGSLNRFQLERGPGTTNSTWLTSYIPTAGVAVARAVDLCTMPIDTWYNSAASTYYIQALETFLNTVACVLFGVYAGAARNGLIHRSSGAIALSDPGVPTTVDLGAPPPVGVIYQAIGTFRNGRQAGSLNGGPVITNAAATLTGGMTTLGVGSAGTLPITGTIFRARYWPRELSNAELQAATLAPVLDYDFTGGVLPAGMSFTRASTATYFDATGLLQTAATNAPRFDYNPATLLTRGLLIEEARTNLFLQSGDFTNASWGKAGCTLAVGIPGPNGAVTGSGLISNNASFGYLPQAVSFTAGTTYTASMFAKAGGNTQTQILMSAAYFNDALNHTVVYNLSTGALGTIVGANTTGTITPVGNGWYRCTMTVLVDITLASTIQMARASTAGDGTTVQHYVFGAQIEAATFATSYIPTTTATVTRAVDVATLPVGTWYNTTTGSWSAEFVVNGPNTTGGRIVGYSTSRGAPLLLDGAASPHAGEYDGAVVYTSNALFVGAVARAASSWTAGTALVGLNGGPVASSAALTGGYAGAVAYKLFADNTASDQITGYFRRVAYWPRALSAAELREATSTGAQVRAMVLA